MRFEGFCSLLIQKTNISLKLMVIASQEEISAKLN